MPASTALPPLRKIASPASAASGCAATTMRRLALTSGFGVKPLGGSGCSKACSGGAPNARSSARVTAASKGLRFMAGSIAAFAVLATPVRLMEVAGSRDDALGAGMTPWMPAWVSAFLLALARVLAAGMLDVIAVGDGKRKLV